MLWHTGAGNKAERISDLMRIYCHYSYNWITLKFCFIFSLIIALHDKDVAAGFNSRNLLHSFSGEVSSNVLVAPCDDRVLITLRNTDGLRFEFILLQKLFNGRHWSAAGHIGWHFMWSSPTSILITKYHKFFLPISFHITITSYLHFAKFAMMVCLSLNNN